MDSPKFSKFDVSTTAYKAVGGQNIKAYVLTPKNLSSGKHPVAVKFHGGWFISGHSLYPEWYPQWALDYCLLHSAIIVTGDYRLLPESTTTELYEDVSDFWNWIRGDLQKYLDTTRPGIEADLSRVLVHGESAGGTISIVSAFSQPRGFIKAILPTYPVTTMNPKRSKPIFGAPPIPKTVLEQHLSSMEPGKIVTEATPPNRLNLAISMVQQESLGQHYGTDQRYDVWKLLEKAEEIPYTLVLHGDQDSGVPVQGSIDWVAAVKKKFGEGSIKLHIEPDGDHGFDAGIPLETPWLQEGLKTITAKWLSQDSDSA